MWKFKVFSTNLCKNELCYPGFNMNDPKTRKIAYQIWLDPHMHCFKCNRMLFKGESFYRTHHQRASKTIRNKKHYCKTCIETLYH